MAKDRIPIVFMDYHDDEGRRERFSAMYGDKYTETAHNLHGDYVTFENDDPEQPGECGVEWKSCNDALGSIKNVSLFNQSRNCAENFKQHFLVIEGYMWQYIAQNVHIDEKADVLASYNGAIASCDMNTHVKEFYNEAHAFTQMKLWFLKTADSKNRQLTQIDKRFDFMTVVIRAMKDIKDQRSDLLIEHLDLEVVEDLTSIKYRDLIKIPGIGEVLAKNILEHIYRDVNVSE